jgi:hypothetical protein
MKQNMKEKVKGGVLSPSRGRRGRNFHTQTIAQAQAFFFLILHTLLELEFENIPHQNRTTVLALK